MSHELYFTSAPRGLQAGRSGFCTVACTKGMHPVLAQVLESLSVYRQVFPPQHPDAPLNPIVHSHIVVYAGGQRFSVLSRTASAGLDYSQRSNRFSHHVALESQERAEAGPAWVASVPGFLETTWDGQLRTLPAGRSAPRGSVPARPCTHWQQLTGDAGWAGRVAAMLADETRPLIHLVFQPGMDLLPLIAEVIPLLPPERRWDATFSTYYVGLPASISCQLRCILKDSPETSAANRTKEGVTLDLTRRLGPAPDDPWAELARRGPSRTPPHAAKSNPAIPPPIPTRATLPSMPTAEAESYRIANEPSSRSTLGRHASTGGSEMPIRYLPGLPPPPPMRRPRWGLWLGGAVALLVAATASATLAVMIASYANRVSQSDSPSTSAGRSIDVPEHSGNKKEPPTPPKPEPPPEKSAESMGALVIYISKWLSNSDDRMELIELANPTRLRLRGLSHDSPTGDAYEIDSNEPLRLMIRSRTDLRSEIAEIQAKDGKVSFQWLATDRPDRQRLLNVLSRCVLEIHQEKPPTHLLALRPVVQDPPWIPTGDKGALHLSLRDGTPKFSDVDGEPTWPELVQHDSYWMWPGSPRLRLTLQADGNNIPFERVKNEWRAGIRGYNEEIPPVFQSLSDELEPFRSGISVILNVVSGSPTLTLSEAPTIPSRDLVEKLDKAIRELREKDQLGAEYQAACQWIKGWVEHCRRTPPPMRVVGNIEGRIAGVPVVLAEFSPSAPTFDGPISSLNSRNSPHLKFLYNSARSPLAPPEYLDEFLPEDHGEGSIANPLGTMLTGITLIGSDSRLSVRPKEPETGEKETRKQFELVDGGKPVATFDVGEKVLLFEWQLNHQGQRAELRSVLSCCFLRLDGEMGRQLVALRPLPNVISCELIENGSHSSREQERRLTIEQFVANRNDWLIEGIRILSSKEKKELGAAKDDLKVNDALSIDLVAGIKAAFGDAAFEAELFERIRTDELATDEQAETLREIVQNFVSFAKEDENWDRWLSPLTISLTLTIKDDIPVLRWKVLGSAESVDRERMTTQFAQLKQRMLKSVATDPVKTDRHVLQSKAMQRLETYLTGHLHKKESFSKNGATLSAMVVRSMIGEEPLKLLSIEPK